MAKVAFVAAEDLEDGDLIDASDHLHYVGKYVKVDGAPEDLDTWNVIIHTSQGNFWVSRIEEIPFGEPGTPGTEEWS